MCVSSYGLFNRLLSLERMRRGGLTVSAFDTEASGPGSSPAGGHCVEFLGKTLYSNSTSLHPGEKNGYRRI